MSEAADIAGVPEAALPGAALPDADVLDVADAGSRVAPGGRGPFAQPAERRLLALVLAALVILWLARDVLGPFVVAGLLAYAFSPLVAAGSRRTGLPRPAVALTGYLVGLTLLGVATWVIGGRLVAEVEEFATGGPDSLAATLTSLLGGPELQIGSQHIAVADIAAQFEAALGGLVASLGDALHLASLVGEYALHVFLVVIVSYYLVLDGGRFGAYGLRLLEPEHRQRARILAGRIHEVLGRWLLGQLFLIGLVAVVVYLILGPALHLPYALALGLLTGVLEVIPLVGPIAAAGVAVLVAFTHGGAPVAGVVLIIYVALRQVEDQLVMPVVIGRAVHLHPVVTIFAVLVGLANWGVLGGLLGVPVAAALNVTMHELGLDRPTEEPSSPRGSVV
ncbi:MAG: AI-2E family transporter [Candidatus Limnocylindrales bacterium]